MDDEAPNVGKTRLSITQAAKYAWINRTYFYEKYITPKLVIPHIDERGRPYIELSELIFAIGPLPSSQEQQSARQQLPTTNIKQADNTGSPVSAQVLQARIEGLEATLKLKDEIVRMKDEQLRENAEREIFYKEELRTMRLLAAPMQKAAEVELEKLKKNRKWFWPFR